MSSSIWTRCAGGSEIVALRLEPWRVVEGQHQVSTRKLVGSDAEQALLEDLIETVKPGRLEPSGLHYLLATPFRYPPLRHGSRFGGRFEPALWYGAETLEAALAEVAYYRMVFLEGTTADLDGIETELTSFRARVRTERGADLTVGRFAEHRAALASPESYAASQATGADMRAAGIHAFRYPSARHAGGVGVALFEAAAFARKRPYALEAWHCIASRARVEMRKRDYLKRVSFSFARDGFLVGDRLPAPAV